MSGVGVKMGVFGRVLFVLALSSLMVSLASISVVGIRTDAMVAELVGLVDGVPSNVTCVGHKVLVTVVREESGNPLSDVSIDVSTGKKKLYFNLHTNRSGQVVFNTPVEGLYTVSLERINYRDLLVYINVSNCSTLESTTSTTVATTSTTLVEHHGSSTYGPCTADLDCVAGGCNGEICSSSKEEQLVSVCVYDPPYPSELDYFCGCIEEKCQWIKSTTTSTVSTTTTTSTITTTTSTTSSTTTTTSSTTSTTLPAGYVSPEEGRMWFMVLVFIFVVVFSIILYLVYTSRRKEEPKSLFEPKDTAYSLGRDTAPSAGEPKKKEEDKKVSLHKDIRGKTDHLESDITERRSSSLEKQ